MNFLEALKSGRRFRKKSWEVEGMTQDHRYKDLICAARWAVMHCAERKIYLVGLRAALEDLGIETP